ncbi:MAG: DUF262 domain-containing protein [Candidatus Limisoma sp.]
MSYNHTSIKSIIDKLNSSYFVPDIQRSYVWLQNPKLKKIEQLFDSLMRGYPIGSFLFWELKKSDIESDFDVVNESGKLNFQLYKFIENYDARKANNEKINVSQIVNEDLHIVLDGQQRLTSLYIGLRGTRCLKRAYARANALNLYEIKRLYLNVLHKPEDENPEDCYRFEFKTEDEVKNANENELWFGVGKIMDFNNRNEARSYCRERGYNRDATDMVEDLWSVINDKDVISFFEETEKSLDKVLRIFIRVNSGGMQLSYSDLLMSLLTATFKSEIREQMEEVVSRMKEDGFECLGRDQILKTCMMLSDCNHIFKMENFSKTNIKRMETNWDNVISCIYTTTALLKSMGYADHLFSGYIIAVISLYLLKKGISKPNPEDKKAMVSFVQIAQMRSYFSTSLDTKLSMIKEYINDSNDFSEFLEKLNKDPNFVVDGKYLEWAIDNVKYGSAAVLPILQMLYPSLNYGTVSFHIDHIYPKSKFNKKNKQLPTDFIGRENELWNLQLLEGSTNEEKNDKDPEEWLNAKITEIDKRKEYLNNNYIKEDDILSWSNLSQFAANRKTELLVKLKQLFNVV